MFLEMNFTIIDYEKRFLNLSNLCKDLPGWNYFGKWKDKGNYIQCKGEWIYCFSDSYYYILYKSNLSYKDKNKNIKPFTEVHNNSPLYTMSALTYIMMNYYVPSKSNNK